MNIGNISNISIPKTLKSIDQLKSEGKYCPEEIEIINNKISQEKEIG